MKNILTATNCRAVLFSVAGLAALTAAAQDSADSKWRVSFGPSVLFNVSARFQGHPGNVVPTGVNDQPGAANYDNGFVGLDISGDPNFSTYWGYTQASQQITSGGNITGLNYERTTPDAGATSPRLNSDPGWGGQIVLRRELTKFGEARFGLELGAAFNQLRFTDNSSYFAAAQRTTSSYNLPGPVNSALFPPPGYQGPFNGAGPVINPTASVGATTTIPNAVLVSGRRDVDASVIGFQFGPYLELPITKQFSASVSAGALLAVVHDRVNWSETLSVNTASASGYYSGQSSVTGSSWGVTAGFYAGAGLDYQISQKWNLSAGAQFQDAGTYSHELGQGKMKLDLGKTINFNLGIGYSF